MCLVRNNSVRHQRVRDRERHAVSLFNLAYDLSVRMAMRSDRYFKVAWFIKRQTAKRN
jgi:hypothetical protein